MSARATPDHYEMLQISRSASDDVIRAAYRSLMKVHHPDRGGDPSVAAAIHEAYATLSDPDLRRRHDAVLHGSGRRARCARHPRRRGDTALGRSRGRRAFRAVLGPSRERTAAPTGAELCRAVSRFRASAGGAYAAAFAERRVCPAAGNIARGRAPGMVADRHRDHDDGARVRGGLARGEPGTSLRHVRHRAPGSVELGRRHDRSRIHRRPRAGVGRDRRPPRAQRSPGPVHHVGGGEPAPAGRGGADDRDGNRCLVRVVHGIHRLVRRALHRGRGDPSPRRPPSMILGHTSASKIDQRRA
ncbi:J domain-containing protein [Microbacterium resistens]|uniref:J domain-containing protein n=1 Tax=Microbacterium resistens TaxID=156977 RepID=A0ABY3RR31_9MICO|nr:J domain-containing protein [Microbacterium resistens]